MNRAMRIIPFFTLVAMLAGVNAFALPLTGQTLSGSSTFTTLTPPQAVVGTGIEFKTYIDSVIDPFFEIDFTENGLVTVEWAYTGGLGHYAPEVLSFWDTFGTIAGITALDLISTSGVTGVIQSDLSFTLDSISLNVGSGTVWNEGGFFTAEMQFVPEPSTFVLLGLGMLGILGRILHPKKY